MAKFIKKDFEEWLNKQPEDRQFIMENIKKCLFFSFLNETGQDCLSMGVEHYYDSDRILKKCPEWSAKVQRGVQSYSLPTVRDIKSTWSKFYRTHDKKTK